jgi:hypothetical protein
VSLKKESKAICSCDKQKGVVKTLLALTRLKVKGKYVELPMYACNECTKNLAIPGGEETASILRGDING